MVSCPGEGRAGGKFLGSRLLSAGPVWLGRRLPVGVTRTGNPLMKEASEKEAGPRGHTSQRQVCGTEG